MPTAPAPAAPEAPLPDPPRVDEVLRSHAELAAPRWQGAADLLVHSPHPEFAELAGAMAARLHEAEAGLPAGRRQELINEERQLLHFLRQRYAGFEPLERPLDRIDRSLADLEAVPVDVVASPKPVPEPMVAPE